MAHRAYRAPIGYWVLSTFAVVTLALIVVLIVSGIPGFPHFSEALAKWRGFYGVHSFEALTLALVWMTTAVGFSYVATRSLLALVHPLSIRGVLELAQPAEPGARSAWVKVSGVQRRIRYERTVFNLLASQGLVGALVDLRVGVGDRVISVDILKERDGSPG